MATTIVVCPDCGASLAHGRLSCSECGALLASVAGGSRRAARPAMSAAEAWSSLEPSPDPATATTTPPEAPAPPQPEATAQPEAPAPPQPEAPAQPEPPQLAPPISPSEHPLEPSTPDVATAPLAVAVAGAYLPPSATFGPTVVDPSAARRLDRAQGTSPRPATDRPTEGFGTPDGPAGWLVVAGSSLAIAALLLPWAPNGVIGSQGDPGLLGQWGLANPRQVLVLAAAAALLVTQLARGPIPGWLAPGLLGPAFGGLLLGIAWTYLSGPFGLGLGAALSAIGGAALVAAGVVERLEARHEAPASGV